MIDKIQRLYKTKSILFVISSLGTGGAERVVSELSNYFCSKDFKVHILLLSDDTVSYEINKNIHIIHGCHQVKGNNRISDFFSRIRIIKKYNKHIQPDITISFLATINIYTCLALGFSKEKVIISERNDPQKSPSSVIKRVFRNKVYFLADGFVFQTNHAKEYFYKSMQNRSKVIANPIKANLPKVYTGKRVKKIIAVGRLEKQKNYPLFIKAFRWIADDFQDYSVEIYGEGQQRRAIAQLIEELGLSKRVFLMGRHQDVHEQIRDASLYVLTSHYEGMPNALMEAMALGLPCISVDCSGGGPKTLIRNGVNGMLVTNDDAYVLAQQMRAVLQNELLINKISTNASCVREEYSIETIGDRWLDYMLDIARSNR